MMLYPTRINRHPNPYAATTAGFASFFSTGAGTGAVAAVSTYGGVTTAYRVTITTAVPDAATGGIFCAGIRADLGSPVTARAKVQASVPITIRIGVEWKNSAGGTILSTQSASVAMPANTVTDLAVTTPNPPPGAVGLTMTLYRYAGAMAVGSWMEATQFLVENTTDQSAPWFGGGYSPTVGMVAAWQGAVNASPTILTADFGNAQVSDGTTTVGAVEIVSSTLRRPLRRDAIDVLSQAAPLITVGTPGLLAGQITYLCASLARALALDALYAGTAPLTLTTSGELTGLKHQAVETPQLVAEKAVNGSPSRWLYTVEIREVP